MVASHGGIAAGKTPPATGPRAGPVPGAAYMGRTCIKAPAFWNRGTAA